MTCPSCGREVPGEFAFCPFCGAALTASPPAAVQEERKVVSVLFCDLVGFTEASSRADPEDVRARIRPYHALLRREIERYGGTVEKFIGDAVMAVFGAPVAHEDDAERSVRAALRILDAIRDLNAADPDLSLKVRVGIATGEAVVALGARPEQGEGIVTGDVVNTASRLQGAAPVDGIAVSEHTFRQTERIFDYEELPPATVKGKPEPLAIWRPLAARARLGTDVTRTHTTPLVGRELEKPLLIGTFERCAQQRSCQLVTIVGEPGVGKSRMCAELSAYIDARPDLIVWRQGRCLPYGEGIAYWALGEIVKAECGILESDSPQAAEAKLDRGLPPDDPDLPWLRARLAPLVGAGGEPASQEESFTAWRRFLESLAEQGPAVLVFEDLHWADRALLSFLEHLADWSARVPLMIVCAARPELYERYPNWAAGLRNSTTINLAPLTEDETARLLGLLLERSVLPAETQRALLERAGGNPLYAEEFVRLLADRAAPADSHEVPDSVQALIASRLDTLSPERKSLLQDAAVIGKVFWAGALAEMADREPREVEQALHELSRKELVRPARASTMANQAEYGFWHVLVRDVCYAQMPRAVRAARHRAAAAWIERQAGDRAEDLADVLAHHYLQALELTRATGHADADLEAAAIRYLALAGERALVLDVASAEASLAKALELAPAGHPERASLLVRWARAAQQQIKLHDARDALEEALGLYRARGDDVAVAGVLSALSVLLQRAGDPKSQEMNDEAVALLQPLPPGPELANAYAQKAGRLYVSSAFREAIADADRALAVAAETGTPVPIRALGARGGARANLGDREGLDDMRRALEVAVERGASREAAVLHNNLAADIAIYAGPGPALDACREGIDFCERRGITEFAVAISAMSVTFLFELGRAEEALAAAAAVRGRVQSGVDIVVSEARGLQLRLFAERGEHGDAPDADALVADTRGSGDSQYLAVGIAAAARLWLAQDRREDAKALLVELAAVPATRGDSYYARVLPELVRTAVALREPALAARLTEAVDARGPLFEHALVACRAQLAEAAGDAPGAAALYADAAERWRTFGNVPERAYALLGEGRCVAFGAEPPLHEARGLFAAMGYAPALAEIDALLARAEPRLAEG